MSYKAAMHVILSLEKSTNEMIIFSTCFGFYFFLSRKRLKKV